MTIEGVDIVRKSVDRDIADQYSSSPPGGDKLEIDHPPTPAPAEFTPPNGGLEAWLLVVALFLIFANTW